MNRALKIKVASGTGLGPRRGVALVAALVFALMAAFMFAVGVEFTTQTLKQGKNSKKDAQVYNVTLAGITHATNWLQRQTTQPVICFDPKANTNLPDDDPETPKTEEQLGLVNEFVVDSQNNLWGRYEIARSTTGPAPAPSRDPSNTTLVPLVGAHSALYSPGPTWTAEDITKQRGGIKPGSIWRVRSRGYLFQRTAANEAFTITNPKPLAQLTLEAEIRRGGYNYHAAALYNYGASAAINLYWKDAAADTVIKSLDGTGYTWWTNANVPSSGSGDGPVSPTGSLDSQNVSSGANYVSPQLAEQLTFTFGVGDLPTVKAMADQYVQATNTLTYPFTPSNKFIYINQGGNQGTVTFDDNHVLNGSGILFVDGDLVIDGDNLSGAGHVWNGMIFVTGKYTQRRTSTITGTVVAGGNTTIAGEDQMIARTFYSPATMDNLNLSSGSYRMLRSTLRSVDDSTAPTY